MRRWFTSAAQELGVTTATAGTYLSPETHFYPLVLFKVTVICATHTAITMVHKEWLISLHSMPHFSLKKVCLDLWKIISCSQGLRTKKLKIYCCNSSIFSLLSRHLIHSFLFFNFSGLRRSNHLRKSKIICKLLSLVHKKSCKSTESTKISKLLPGITRGQGP